MSRSFLRRTALGIATGAACWLVSSASTAQVNGDVGLSAGVMKRFTTGADQGVSDPGFGPAVQVQGHLAALPMLRVGLYLGWDLSPMPHVGTRNFVGGGLHAKFTPPVLPSPWKTYLYAGFGGDYAVASGYTGALGPNNGAMLPASTPVHWGSLDGGLFEVPLGLGLAYKVSGPWELFAELGGRFGFGFLGNLYSSDNTATATIPNEPVTPAANFTGVDSFALNLSVGVSLSD